MRLCGPMEWENCEAPPPPQHEAELESESLEEIQGEGGEAGALRESQCAV